MLQQLAAEIVFIEALALDHRPHRPVEDEDAALKGGTKERFRVVSHGVGLARNVRMLRAE